MSLVGIVHGDNLVGESTGTVHHSFLLDGVGSVLVLLAGDLSLNETVVDIILGNLKTLLGPCGEVGGLDKGRVNGVGVGDGLGLRGVPAPVGVGHGEVGVSAVVVLYGVPDGMEVGGTADVGGLVVIATTVTGSVLVVNLRGGVKRLVNISDVMDDKTESEGLSIGDVRVVNHDIVGVDGVISTWDTLDPVGQGTESLNNVSGGHLVVGVVGDVVTLAEVGQVNEMPV